MEMEWASQITAARTAARTAYEQAEWADERAIYRARLREGMGCANGAASAAQDRNLGMINSIVTSTLLPLVREIAAAEFGRLEHPSDWRHMNRPAGTFPLPHPYHNAILEALLDEKVPDTQVVAHAKSAAPRFLAEAGEGFRLRQSGRVEAWLRGHGLSELHTQEGLVPWVGVDEADYSSVVLSVRERHPGAYPPCLRGGDVPAHICLCPLVWRSGQWVRGPRGARPDPAFFYHFSRFHEDDWPSLQGAWQSIWQAP